LLGENGLAADNGRMQRLSRRLLWFITLVMVVAASGVFAVSTEGQIMESLKRRAPKVDPVAVNGVRYEVTRGPRSHGFKQNSGIISAIEEASGKELWWVAVYPVVYKSGEEQDAQDVFVTSLSISNDGHSLIVENEHGQRFSVRLLDHAIVEAPSW